MSVNLRRNFTVSRGKQRKPIRYPRFAEIVDSRLDELGITGRTLSQRMGVREATVTSWRNGSALPEEENIERLAKELRLSPQSLRQDELVGGAPSVDTDDAVLRVLIDGQREQVRWLREFAARLLEANAAMIRRVPDSTHVDMGLYGPEDQAVIRAALAPKPSAQQGDQPVPRKSRRAAG